MSLALQRCSRLRRSLFGLAICALAVPAATAQDVPAGTTMHIRLQQLVSSFGSERDDRVTATVIAPVMLDGTVRVPLGAQMFGHVEAVRRVGLGLARETAFVEMTFDTLRLPDGTDLPLQARISAIDNARETVDATGRIHGIRGTASFAGILSGAAVSLGAADPMLLAFTVGSSVSVFRIPESEVILPSGAEMRVRLDAPLAATAVFGDIAPPATTSAEQAAALARAVRDLPFRTATEDHGLPSDITNLVFLGSREAVEAAFDAAGWGITDPLTSQSTYATMRAIVENQGYRAAPMSTLLLDGQPPAYTYAKTLDTFFQRHHLRVFGPLGTLGDGQVWTSSSTHDSGIGLATRARAFIHVIDQNIDEERDKVVFDLLMTGCVEGVSHLDRPWVPRDASNATGDALITDGRIAVVRLNACTAPRRADAIAPSAPIVRPKPGRATRIGRDVTLWLKNDLFRGNIFYQGYSGVRRLASALGHRKQPVAGERSITYGGEEFKVVPGAVAHTHDLAPDDPGRHKRPTFHPVGTKRTVPVSTLEFSGSVGGSLFAGDGFSAQTLSIPADDLALAAVGVTELARGPGFNVRTTINNARYLSQEIGYTYNRTTFETVFSADGASSTFAAPAQVRQFNYNLLVHARPNGSWVRPYAAVGPGLQLVRLTDAVESRDRLVRLAFRDVGLLAGAWDFGSDPALEGGGIFQVAFQYGAGVKIHATPRLYFRVDYRETLSPAPDFWSKSYGTPAGRRARARPPRARRAAAAPAADDRGGHRVLSPGSRVAAGVSNSGGLVRRIHERPIRAALDTRRPTCA